MADINTSSRRQASEAEIAAAAATAETAETATETSAEVLRTIKIVSRSTQKSLREQTSGRTAKIDADKHKGVRSYMDWWELVRAMKKANEDISSMVRILEKWVREVRDGMRGPRDKVGHMDERAARDLDRRIMEWLHEVEEVPPPRTRVPRTGIDERSQLRVDD